MAIWNWLFSAGRNETQAPGEATGDRRDPEHVWPDEDEQPDEDSGAFPDPEPVELEITDVLDLHSFPPRDVNDVVRGYLDEAYEQGLRSLRIIHGRGAGVQRKAVRTILERDPRVGSFGDASAEAGGWGATIVEMK